MRFLSIFLILSTIFLFSCSDVQSCKNHSNCKTGYCNPVRNICEETPCLKHTECDVNGKCIIQNNGYPKCECDNGYELDKNNKFACVSKCESNNCSNHGECKIDSEIGAYCECSEGYKASEFDCIIDLCYNQDCSENGSCFLDNNIPKCYCDEGFHSVNLTCAKNTTLCDTETCNNHGHCVLKNGNPKCYCDESDGYFNDGDLDCINPCSNINCGNNSISCTSLSATNLKCNCENGYVEDNNHKCISLCISQNIDCGNNSSCILNENHLPICECDYGYKFRGLECIELCDGETCSNHGSCTINNNEATCTCKNGYHLNPNNQLECISDCVGNEDCGGNGVCGNSLEKAFCTCDNGYQDNNEDLICALACKENDCSTNGICNDTLNNQKFCNCDNNYFQDGVNLSCLTPCIGESCSEHGTCIADSLTEKHCNCDTGYQDNDNNMSCKFGCDNIEICGENGICIDTNGSFTCECSDGNYYLDNYCYSEMVEISTTTFMMGCDIATDFTCEDNEAPQHEVTLSSFMIDRFEVTVSKFRECVIAGACNPDNFDSTRTLHNYGVEGREEHPMNYVSWYGAKEYCEWKDKRLPTEAEWEYAARGENLTKYPWGDSEPTCEHAVYNECNDGYTSEVGSKPLGKTSLGLYDMGGNVWEWTADWYGDYNANSQINPTGPNIGVKHVCRGGSWYNNANYLRTSYRDRYHSTSMNSNVGFRCAKSLSSL